MRPSPSASPPSASASSALYPGGSFDEFDFWTGTFSLVVFALAESILFAWIFGMDRGWEEITRGADLELPRLFRPVIRYVTPLFILVVFVGALVQPHEGRWADAFKALAGGEGWAFAPDSVVGKVLHSGDETYAWFLEGEPTRHLVQDATRILLVLVWLGCAYLVYRAWKRKERAA